MRVYTIEETPAIPAYDDYTKTLDRHIEATLFALGLTQNSYESIARTGGTGRLLSNLGTSGPPVPVDNRNLGKDVKGRMAFVASYAKGAGFSGEALINAIAIAMAESGGIPSRHNDTPPDNSYGLWQINMLGPLQASRLKSLRLNRNEDLFDPAINARSAYIISGGGRNWGPWSTWWRHPRNKKGPREGKLVQYLDAARQAAGF